MFEISSEQISDYELGAYSQNDPHYPQELRRPGLGSHPLDHEGFNPGFDCTVRTDQSRIHFPGEFFILNQLTSHIVKFIFILLLQSLTRYECAMEKRTQGSS